MSLYSSEFLHLFSNDEVRGISILVNGENKEFFLRRLSYRTCSVFRHKSQQMVYRSEFDAMMNANKPSFAFFKEDVDKAEFYLLRKSLCDSMGELVFSEDEDDKFNKFLDILDDDIGNEFVLEILKFNHMLHADNEKDLIEAHNKRVEDEKKKLKP